MPAYVRTYTHTTLAIPFCTHAWRRKEVCYFLGENSAAVTGGHEEYYGCVEELAAQALLVLCNVNGRVSGREVKNIRATNALTLKPSSTNAIAAAGLQLDEESVTTQLCVFSHVF